MCRDDTEDQHSEEMLRLAVMTLARRLAEEARGDHQRMRLADPPDRGPGSGRPSG